MLQYLIIDSCQILYFNNNNNNNNNNKGLLAFHVKNGSSMLS